MAASSSRVSDDFGMSPIVPNVSVETPEQIEQREELQRQKEVFTDFANTIRTELTYDGQLSPDTYTFWYTLGYQPTGPIPIPDGASIEDALLILREVHPIHETIGQVELLLKLPVTGSLEALITNFKKTHYSHSCYPIENPEENQAEYNRCWLGSIQQQDLPVITGFLDSGTLTYEQIQDGLGVGAAENKVESIETIMPYLNRIDHPQLNYVITDGMKRGILLNHLITTGAKSGNWLIVRIVLTDEIVNRPNNAKSKESLAQAAFFSMIDGDQPDVFRSGLLSLISEPAQVLGVSRSIIEKKYEIARVLIDAHLSYPGANNVIIQALITAAGERPLPSGTWITMTNEVNDDPDSGASPEDLDVLEYIIPRINLNDYSVRIFSIIDALLNGEMSERKRIIILSLTNIDDTFQLGTTGITILNKRPELMKYLAQRNPRIVTAVADFLVEHDMKLKITIPKLAIASGARSDSWNDILVWACQYGIFAGMETALKMGANPHYKHDLPLITARNNGFTEMVSYMENYQRPIATSIRNFFR